MNLTIGLKIIFEFQNSNHCKNDINIDHISKQNIIGITAGASAPEILIDEIIEYLESHGASVTENNTTKIEEDITFSLPKELR